VARLSKTLIIGVAVLTLSACSSGAVTPTETADPIPSIAPSLIPTSAPVDVVDVDIEQFAGDFGDYTFRIGDGPTWCTINMLMQNVLCEQNEAAAKYAPIPVPSSCEFSYGYQVQLFAKQPEDGTKIADFVCSGGAYADPTSAGTLNSGERVSLDGITCFVQDKAARCDNENGNYIVLGPEAWAING
jgi:hypothetical protein